VFHFVRSLFLDGVLDNHVILSSIFNNKIQNAQDFENFTKINATPKFEEILDKIKKTSCLKAASIIITATVVIVIAIEQLKYE